MIASYLNRQIVRSDPNPLERVKIRALVFPMYDEGIIGVEIGRPAHDALVPLVLGSLLGEGRQYVADSDLIGFPHSSLPFVGKLRTYLKPIYVVNGSANTVKTM